MKQDSFDKKVLTRLGYDLTTRWSPLLIIILLEKALSSLLHCAKGFSFKF